MLKSEPLKLILGVFVFFALATLTISVFTDERKKEYDNSASLVRLQNKFANNQISIPFLIYHSVRPHIPNESALQDAYDITPEALERQFQYLVENGYHTIYPRDLSDYAVGNLRLPERPVIICFDDGWENQYTYGFPLIKKYNLKAIFYIYTHPIDRGAKHFLTWDQVKDLSAAGMEVGDHTITHPYLMRIIDPNILRREVFGEKLELEKKLGVPIRSFAYPFGGYTDLAISIIRSVGLASARTTYPGMYKSGDDLYKIRGFLIDDDFDTFVKKLAEK